MSGQGQGQGQDQAQPKRSLVCSVCKEDSGTYHLSYGASTCFSCRAFFRRTVQQEKQDTYVCKGVGQCEMKGKSRRKCQLCRYQRCLDAGMQAEAVMDEGSKKMRFRKALQKQKQIMSQQGVPAETEDVGLKFFRKKKLKQLDQHQPKRPRMQLQQTTEPMAANSDLCSYQHLVSWTRCWQGPPMPWEYTLEQGEPSLNQMIGQCVTQMILGPKEQDDKPKSNGETTNPDTSVATSPKKEKEEGVDNYSIPHSPYVIYDDDDPHQVPPHHYLNNNCRVRKRMLKFLDHIRKTWAIALKRMEIDSEFYQALIKFHLGYEIMPKPLLMKHMITLAKLFREYAQQQPEFVALTKADQRRLLCQNSTLFVHYILGRYFTANTGMEQINWILATKLPDDFDEDIAQHLKCYDFSTFNDLVNLFPDSTNEDLVDYNEAAKIMNRPILLLRCNCLISLACLYDTKPSGLFDDINSIQANLEDVFAFAEWAHEVFNCAQKADLTIVVDGMAVMNEIFERNVQWSNDNVASKSADSLQGEVALINTSEESQWLQAQFNNFVDAFKSVSMGINITEDSIMHSFDVPVSISFMTKLQKVYAERGSRILSNFKAFQNLSPLERNEIMTHNHAMARAAIGIKVACFPSGFSQIKFFLGSDDALTFNKHVMGGSSKPKVDLKKLCMSSINKNLGGRLLPEEAAAYYDKVCAQHEDGAIVNLELFILICLVIYSTPGQSTDPHLKALHQVFTMFLDKWVISRDDIPISKQATSLKEEVKNIFNSIHKLVRYYKQFPF